MPKAKDKQDKSVIGNLLTLRRALDAKRDPRHIVAPSGTEIAAARAALQEMSGLDVADMLLDARSRGQGFGF